MNLKYKKLKLLDIAKRHFSKSSNQVLLFEITKSGLKKKNETKSAPR